MITRMWMHKRSKEAAAIRHISHIISRHCWWLSVQSDDASSPPPHPTHTHPHIHTHTHPTHRTSHLDSVPLLISSPILSRALYRKCWLTRAQCAVVRSWRLVGWLLEFYVLAIFKVIRTGAELWHFGTHGHFIVLLPLGNHSTGTMTWYPTQLCYLETPSEPVLVLSY